MSFEFIPTRPDYENRPHIRELIDRITENQESLGLEDGALYYGWPQLQDYDANIHPVDLTIASRAHGLIMVRCLAETERHDLQAIDQSIAQAAASTQSQMMKSSKLRDRRKLKFDVVPVVFALGGGQVDDVESEFVYTYEDMVELISDLRGREVRPDDLLEIRSILEGAKALGRPVKRKIEDPDGQPLAVELGRLEEEIASFDARQRNIALTNLNCPQRIRGLAGSGKTVILAMKAAMAHNDNPDAQILFTYYTKSLRHTVKRMISRFYRHFAEGEPNWDRIDVQHGWGKKDTLGVYREAAVRHGIRPLSWMDAKQKSPDPFDFVCKDLLGRVNVSSHYDLILIDEGQDFPEGFYQLCFHLAKGDRDQKHIVWAYDELQNIFNVDVRTPDVLFGQDDDGQPRISLGRSLPPYAGTNDFVLQKCYRNQRDVLVLAHAIGFGLYSHAEPVQMLQNKEHWEDVGYDVKTGPLVTGQNVTIERPSRNSPTGLNPTDGFPLISHSVHDNVSDEVEACSQQIQRFIAAGIEPHEIMVIAIDDRSAKGYLKRLSTTLSMLGISSNNIIQDSYTEPPFLIEGKVTMSTVYRAKGNEAAVVLVLGCDAVNLRTRVGRNRLFTAFTRSKAWLRILGCSLPQYIELQGEIDAAIRRAPDLAFVMPDIARINTIQRDLTDKDARILEARNQMEQLREELGLSEEDLLTALEREGQ